MILVVGWSPLLGVILLDLSLSPAKATVTKEGILTGVVEVEMVSHKLN